MLVAASAQQTRSFCFAHGIRQHQRRNKLFSTAEPLGTFLRLAATWAHLHRVQFEVEHLAVAGEKNVWADKLSRGNTCLSRAPLR